MLAFARAYNTGNYIFKDHSKGIQNAKSSGTGGEKISTHAYEVIQQS